FLTGATQTTPDSSTATIPEWHEIATNPLSPSDGHMGEVLAIKEISANPRQLTSIGGDGNILVWNLPEGVGHIVSSLRSPAQLATFGTSKALIAWTSGLTINVACVTGCSERWTLTRLKSRSTSLAFHENDTAVVIGGADGRVYRWQFLKESDTLSVKEREKILERYIAHQTMVSAVLSLHTGRAFFSADWDGALYGWLAYTADDQQGDYDKNLFGGRFFGNIGNYFRAPRLTDRGITSLALSSDGSHLVVGTDDGAVEVWKVRGFEMVARSSLHNGRVTGVALNAEGSKTLSVGRDGRVVTAQIVKDPLFRIQANSLPSKLEVVLTETVPNAKGVSFLSTDDAIVSTSDGHLGEIRLPKEKPSLSVATPLPTPIGTTSHDSDY
ncbi:MAG: hypothetical protein RL326_1827, partial [Pseudomonadota bacterium]